MGAATMNVPAAMSGQFCVYSPKNEYSPRVTGHSAASDSMTNGRMRLFQAWTNPKTAKVARAGFICGMMIVKMNRT